MEAASGLRIELSDLDYICSYVSQTNICHHKLNDTHTHTGEKSLPETSVAGAHAGKNALALALALFTCGGARRSISGTFSFLLLVEIESLLRDTD